MSFDKLKKNRAKALDKLSQEFAMEKKQGFKDPDAGKYWKPTTDATTGTGKAVIRFLMGDPDSDNDPNFVTYWDHAFKGPTGQWYIEKSRTSIGQGEKDPVAESNSELWNSGIEENKEIARKRKRNLRYVSNILVVKDPAHPENEGKVFMFRYGKKIFDKIQAMLTKDEDDDEVVSPFDIWDGVNFRLNIKTVAGFPNYDDSEFARNQTPIADSDEEMERIWNLRYNLNEIIDPETAFKSYDELKARFDAVVGNTSRGGSSSRDIAFDDDEDEAEEDNKYNLSNKFKSDDEDEIPSAKAREIPSSNNKSFDDEDEDEDMAYFQNLTKK